MKKENSTEKAEFLRINELMQLLGVRSYSGMYRIIRREDFPQPKRLGRRIVLYDKQAVLQFMQNVETAGAVEV